MRFEKWHGVGNDFVMLEDLDVFADFFVVQEREDGLTRLRVTRRADGAWHHIAFPEPAYDIGDEPNAEFDTPAYRFRYQSMVTPATVYEYDVEARRLTVLKQQEVLGGYDPARYETKRIWATARDNTKVPVSLVYKKGVALDGSTLDERTLATFERTAAGQVQRLSAGGGELVYMRRTQPSERIERAFAAFARRSQVGFKTPIQM